jgi:hypothetical protein
MKSGLPRRACWGFICSICARAAAAAPMIQWPIFTMSPDSSAAGMKLSGITVPRCGCIQRISASNPATDWSARRMIGW